MKKRERKPIDPVKQFREWMKNTLRRAFFRYWERTKALQTARVDRGLYKCAGCLQVAKIEGHHIDHIDPVVDPKVGFVDWDVYIKRLFCSSSNLQLLCKECHTSKTAKEREERKLHQTGVYKLGKTLPEEVKQKISESHKGISPANLKDIQEKRKIDVEVLNLSTQFLNVCSSLTEASKLTGASIGNITTICKGNTKRKQSHGYSFKYKTV